MKVKSRVYRGIEFVYLHDLPDGQRALLNGSTPERIKILMDGVVMECISYSAYTEWFKAVYKAPKPIPEKSQPAETVFIPKE
jgi:hypothetical protein